MFALKKTQDLYTNTEADLIAFYVKLTKLIL